MKRLGVFMLPPGWDASPSQGYPQHYAGTHLYTWVERSTMRVKCLEHNTMSPARPRTRTTRSGVERTNHEATVPPTVGGLGDTKKIKPFALRGHGSIAHSASPHGLLTRSPCGLRVSLLNDTDMSRNVPAD